MHFGYKDAQALGAWIVARGIGKIRNEPSHAQPLTEPVLTPAD